MIGNWEFLIMAFSGYNLHINDASDTTTQLIMIYFNVLLYGGLYVSFIKERVSA